MTAWRDARLRRALDAAPDADAVPGEAARHAIREAARRAIATKPAARSGWRRWWDEPGQRMPWNAAFATVLLAVLVGVLWHGQEVPGVRPEAESARPAEKSTATASQERADTGPPSVPPAVVAPAPSAAPRRAPATAPAGAPIPSMSAERGRTPRPQEAQQPRPPPAGPDERLAESRRGQSQTQSKAQADAQMETQTQAQAQAQRRDFAQNKSLASDAAGSSAQGSLAAAPPATLPMPSQGARQDARQGARQDGPQAVPQAAPMAKAAPSPPLPAAVRSEFAAPPGWTALRVQSEGRDTVVPRDRAGQLASLVQRAIAAASGTQPFAATPTLRIELLRGDQRVGVLELAGDQVRFTDAAAGAAAEAGAIDSALADALRAEAARVPVTRP
ncbi:MAG TPA: hypothetical protein VHA82_17155 [Ramlibacter sp.]|uniref:hypothetical protein n=1 Tax=Ramlibacter sp. TaxID=1917967 RepID=UPI002D1917A9|nr:hypothetical protein [Ramlibacter sp.]HVZ45542.1 hypothetical protein [Ramlibacter sp.]